MISDSAKLDLLPNIMLLFTHELQEQKPQGLPTGHRPSQQTHVTWHGRISLAHLLMRRKVAPNCDTRLLAHNPRRDIPCGYPSCCVATISYGCRDQATGKLGFAYRLC